MARRRKSPIPAALDVTAMEQLGPLDLLRLRLVAHDPGVQEALRAVAEAHGRVVEARAVAANSLDAAQRYALTVRAHEAALRELLEPAVASAERRRALLVTATPPDHASLASKVVRRVDGDRLLALDALLRRNPNWRDPALWSQPETVRYLARTVATEARYLALLQQESERPAVSRGERPFKGPSETVAIRREQVRQKRVALGLARLRKLRASATPEMRRLLDRMSADRCGPFAAASREGVPRGVAVALRARADRLLSRERKLSSSGR